MKETVKSLRAYFILAGLASAYLDVRGLMSSPGILVQALDGAGLLVALGFLYVGVALPKLLVGSTGIINALLGVCVLFALASGGLSLMSGAGVMGGIMAVISLVICYYLYANVARLSAEARAALPPKQPA